MSRVDWDKMKALWRKSHGAVPLTPQEVDSFLGVLDFILKEEKAPKPFARDNNIIAIPLYHKQDGFFGALDVIAQVRNQGEEHRFFHFTHGDQLNCKVVETFVVPPQAQAKVLRYFKIQMFCKGNAWKNPGQIKELRYSYHPSSEFTVEVIYAN